MAMRMTCPCGTTLTVQGAAPGQEVECVGCGQRLRIPPKVQAAKPEPRVRAAPPPRQAASQAVYRDAPASAKPRGGGGGLAVFGFLVALAAAGGVYYIMNERVLELETALGLTAQEGLESTKETHSMLAEEEKRASGEEDALRKRVEEQEEKQQALTLELRKASRDAVATHAKIEAEMARHDAEIKAAAQSGADTATLVSKHEAQLTSLQAELKIATKVQRAVRKELQGVNLELDDLKQAFLEAAIQSAKLQADMKLGDDALRTDLQKQQKEVARLKSRLRGASGARQIKIAQQLAKAERDLRGLEKKVATAPPPSPALLALRLRLARLEKLKRAAAIGANSARAVASGLDAATNSAMILTCDTATGQSVLTTLNATARSKSQTPIPGRLSGSSAVHAAGRFEVLAGLNANGDLAEFIRLDTQTGELWHMPISGAKVWNLIHFGRSAQGANGSYHVDLIDSRAARSSSLRVLVLTDVRTGESFSDLLAPRFFVL